MTMGGGGTSQFHQDLSPSAFIVAVVIVAAIVTGIILLDKSGALEAQPWPKVEIIKVSRAHADHPGICEDDLNLCPHKWETLVEGSKGRAIYGGKVGEVGDMIPRRTY